MKDKEVLYNNQLFVPPTFPQILRSFAKAAIRTQPYDLLVWSASYFKALSEERLPMVKERLEYPLARSQSGLTIGYLKMLNKQFFKFDDVEKSVLYGRWNEICLDEINLKQILCLAGVYKDVKLPLFKFFSIAASFLSKSLTQTMIILCDIYTEEPEGGSAAISSEFFIKLYKFLAPIDASKENKYIDGVLEGAGVKSIDIGEETSDDQSLCGTNSKQLISSVKKDSTDADNITLKDIDKQYSEEESKSLTDIKKAFEKNDGRKSQSNSIDTVELIEELNKMKDEKVKGMDMIINSLGNLAEKSIAIYQNAEKICKQKFNTSKDSNSIKGSVDRGLNKSGSIDSATVDPKAKGVVNPVLKGLFDNVADKMMVIRAFQDQISQEPEVIIVPPVPGIGPPVDDETAEEFIKFVQETASDQCNMFMPRDIRHCYCPPLEKHLNLA